MNARRPLLVVLAAATLVVAAACGSKKSAPVNYSAPVDITLNVKSSDVTGGSILSLKNINTVPGNPFAAFVTEAKAKLGGNDPTSISLGALTFAVTSGGNAGINTLDQIFTGPVAIAFQMNTTTASYPAGSGNGLTGVSATLTPTFDSTQMTPADYSSFLGGQFKVAVSGSAAAGFAAASANVPMKATFTFEAFK